MLGFEPKSLLSYPNYGYMLGFEPKSLLSYPLWHEKFLTWELWLHAGIRTQILVVLPKLWLHAGIRTQILVVLPIVTWEVSDICEVSAKILKDYNKAEIRTHTYYIKNFCPNLTAETIY